MTAEKFLMDNGLGNVVLNAVEYPKNTPENAKKWIYVSDVMEEYAKQKVKEYDEWLEVSYDMVSNRHILGHDPVNKFFNQ